MKAGLILSCPATLSSAVCGGRSYGSGLVVVIMDIFSSFVNKYMVYRPTMNPSEIEYQKLHSIRHNFNDDFENREIMISQKIIYIFDIMR